MEHMIQHIESEQPLAIVFNKVISKITTLWIMTRPRIFDDIKGEEAAFIMMTYYQILLWEKWLEDYNPDGSIKTTGITYEQFRYHTIFFDLDQEEAVWDF
jgi:hypothetical protein